MSEAEIKFTKALGSKGGAAWFARLRPSSWEEAVFQRVVFASLLALTIVAIIVLRYAGVFVLPAFEFLMANLPLTLPIITVALSVMLRPDQLIAKEGWLNLSNHFALGLVTFSIWAFVAGQTVPQYITINPKIVLNKDHSLLLVFVSFIWAGFCSVVSALASIGNDVRERKWELLQTALVAISFALMLMPFYLFESKQKVEERLGISFDEKMFTVSIPYRDSSLNQHLGRSSNPITQTQLMRGVQARTAREAIEKSLEEFRKGEDSWQFTATSRDSAAVIPQRRKVEILENMIVAQPEDR